MSNKKKGKRKNQGHYCWSCDRRRANEKFSGKGHARHICKDCQRLSAEELAYRQACRDLERCITINGIIRHKARKQFETFLEHKNPRVRQLAEEAQAIDQQERAFQQAMREEEELFETEYVRQVEYWDPLNYEDYTGDIPF